MSRAIRFDTQAQFAGFVILIGLLIPASMVWVGDADFRLRIGLPMGGVLTAAGITWLVLRLTQIRRTFAEGDDVKATIADLRPWLVGQRAIVLEYEMRGRPARACYYLSSKLLPWLVPGRSVDLVVHPDRPTRPFLVELYRS